MLIENEIAEAKRKCKIQMEFTNLPAGIFSNVSSGIISAYQWLGMVGRFGFKSPYNNEVNNSLENDISYDKKLLHLARKFSSRK